MSGPQPDEPNYFVLIAPGADSNDPTPAFVDVSTDLRSVSVRRGADKHLDEDQPAEAIIVLDNFEGTYDNDNSGSPYAGLLVTDMRVRVLAEWDGEPYERFNGYLDDIDLEYPDGDAEAWAVLRCTDAFKVLAGTALPRSVYTAELEQDAPEFWWRLGENLAEGDEERVALNSGSVGVAGNGTYTGAVTFNASGMIVNDPGSAVAMTSSDVFAGVPVSGVDIPVDQVNLLERVNNRDPFTLEVWVRPKTSQTQALVFFMRDPTGSISSFALFWFNDTGAGNSGEFLWRLAKTSTEYDIQTGSSSAPPGTRYHVVLTGTADGANLARSLYLDGVLVDSDTVAENAFDTTGVDHNKWGGGVVAGSNFTGELQEAAIYLAVLSDDRITAHNSAGRTPWDGDTPAQRADRICDLIGWPELLRDFDDGESTLQSAELGQAALDHLLKVAASEFGELHVSKEGAILLRSRRSLVNRDPLAEFGPSADEVRYRTIRFASGADLVRNPVTVSRLEGVAQTVEAPATYYPHQFTLDGLFHDSDDLSLSAAEFLLSEFKDQKRRISGLTFGPFEGERLYDWFPFLLEAELGDVYQVTFHPPNGDDLVQVSVLEGTEESWSAESGIGEISWSLSRAYAGGGAFWQLGVHGRSELGETTRLYF